MLIVEGKKWQIEEDLGNTTEGRYHANTRHIFNWCLAWGKKDAEGWKPNPLIY